MRFKEAAKNYNEIEALASLFVSEECVQLLESIKTLIIVLQKEFKESIAKGKFPKNRHETEKGKEYDLELKKLEVLLKNWIDS